MKQYVKLILMACLFCLLSYQLIAQKTLLIKPTLGFVYPFASLAPPSSASLQISRFSLLSLQPGLDLQLALNTKWRFSVGWHYSVYGMSYKTTSSSRAVSGDMMRMPLQVHYSFVDNIQVLNVDPSQYAYLFMFRIYAIAALDYNYVFNKVSMDVAGRLQADGVISVQESVIENRSNLSPGIGIGIQFFDRVDHDRIDMSFYYSTGLSLLAYQDVIYQGRAGNEQIRLLSNGSLFGINIAYPIRFPL